MAKDGKVNLDLSDTQTLKGWKVHWDPQWYQDTMARIHFNFTGQLPLLNLAKTAWRICVTQDAERREVVDMQRRPQGSSPWVSINKLRLK